jgi:two-component system cell cycle sensor histidine kinase/response regulator CckA
MAIPLRVLMVEDSDDDAALLARELRNGGYDIAYQRIDTAAAMTAALTNSEWDLVTSDHSMPRFSGTGALKLLREIGSDVPFIFVSGTIGEEAAVFALKNGAQDYIMKGNLKRLVPAVQRELRERQSYRERVLLEQQLKQAQKMEAIGRLAGGIAHDFNNLLGVIIGYSDVLLDGGTYDLTTRKQIGEIKRAGERAATLTRQLLAFSRQQVLSPKILNLNSIVTEMEKMLRRIIDEHIDLQILLKPDLGSAKADPGQMDQIILNLAVNARDAMPDGGKLTIETSNIELDEAYTQLHPPMSPGRFVMLAVTDTGIGMGPEIQSHIFEPFFTTKELGKGTGLGLATVHGIVSQNGGFISVYSEPGCGSTFKVYFPRVEEVAEGHTKQPTDDADYRGSETILLVEDAGALRELAHSILTSYGYKVLKAENGAKALEMANQEEGPIHLLLTDVVMPVMGGHELAERLTLLRPEMKVVYMSGYTDATVARLGAHTPDLAVLQKPFTKRDLARKVRDVIG